jgi:RimJ/RimL family protein N-acetyltransferase
VVDHQEIVRHLQAFEQAGFKRVYAAPDPEVPRAVEFMKFLGFQPTGAPADYEPGVEEYVLDLENFRWKQQHSPS